MDPATKNGFLSGNALFSSLWRVLSGAFPGAYDGKLFIQTANHRPSPAETCGFLDMRTFHFAGACATAMDSL